MKQIFKTVFNIIKNISHKNNNKKIIPIEKREKEKGKKHLRVHGHVYYNKANRIKGKKWKYTYDRGIVLIDEINIIKRLIAKGILKNKVWIPQMDNTPRH